MIYRKLKRTFSNGYANYMPSFLEEFPELKNIDSEEACRRFRKLKMVFYYEEKAKSSFLVRLTLPIALVVYLVMLIGLPLNYIISGNWGYSLGDKNYIYNWFKALGL